MFTHNCICISTSKELLLTYSVIQSSFFLLTTISGDVYLQLYLHPTQIGELLLTYSVTQSVFSHDMSSHFYYARLSIQICIFALIKEWSSLTFLVTRAYSRWYCLQLYLHPVPTENYYYVTIVFASPHQ